MAPTGNSQAERMARMEEKLDGFERYERERWHKLNNDIQPVIGLPVQFARDIAKLEARLDAKIDGRLAAIEGRLTAIEGQRQQFTGAQRFGVWIVQTIVSAVAAVAGVLALRGGH